MHRPVIANEHAAYERMVLWITPQLSLIHIWSPNELASQVHKSKNGNTWV